MIDSKTYIGWAFSPAPQIRANDEVANFDSYYFQTGPYVGIEKKLTAPVVGFDRSIMELAYSYLGGSPQNLGSSSHELLFRLGAKADLFNITQNTPLTFVPKIGLGGALNWMNFGRGFPLEMEPSINGQIQLGLNVIPYCNSSTTCLSISAGLYAERALLAPLPYNNYGGFLSFDFLMLDSPTGTAPFHPDEKLVKAHDDAIADAATKKSEESFRLIEDARKKAEAEAYRKAEEARKAKEAKEEALRIKKEREEAQIRAELAQSKELIASLKDEAGKKADEVQKEIDAVKKTVFTETFDSFVKEIRKQPVGSLYLLLPMQINFGNGNPDITLTKQEFPKIRKILKSNPQLDRYVLALGNLINSIIQHPTRDQIKIEIHVKGYANDTGKPDINKQLALDRVQSVIDYLVRGEFTSRLKKDGTTKKHTAKNLILDADGNVVPPLRELMATPLLSIINENEKNPVEAKKSIADDFGIDAATHDAGYRLVRIEIVIYKNGKELSPAALKEFLEEKAAEKK